MLRRTLCILLLPLFAAACGGDGEDSGGQRTGAQADSAGMMDGPEERVTPAESAAAARDVQRHADSMRDAVRRASGAPDPDPEPSASQRVGNSKEERYEACMRQANVSDEPMRTRLAVACANIRNQPER